MSLQYYVLDVESTGLRASYHEITEISIIRVSDKMQISRNVKCWYPERASIDALAITGKSLPDLEKGMERADVVAECNKFLDEDGLTSAHRCIIGHSVSFDRRFLHALWQSVGQEFPADMWMDTMALTRDWAKKQGIIKPKVNLHASCDLFGIKKISTAQHSAKMDSRNTFFLYRHLIDEKKVNFLPFIKTAKHVISEKEECGLDPDLLDIEIE